MVTEPTHFITQYRGTIPYDYERPTTREYIIDLMSNCRDPWFGVSRWGFLLFFSNKDDAMLVALMTEEIKIEPWTASIHVENMNKFWG